MPIYEYRCEACGHTLDALQKLADEPLKDCPECAASALKRLVSAPAFRLKGSGWYETDFKSGTEKKRNLAEGGAKKDDSSQASGAKASEPAKTAESKSESKKDGGKDSGGKSAAAKDSSSGGSSTAAA
jgi:putative FmdB family regulatory protein